MYVIHNYIPETNHVTRIYSVASLLYLQFVLHVMLLYVKYVLYFYIITSRNVRAVPNIVVFCSSLISCFPSMLLGYYLRDFEMVPVALISTGITFVFTFHV